MNQPTRDAIEIWNAGVDAVRPEPLIRREVRVDGDQLFIRESVWHRRDFDRILVVGGGKAGSGMAKGLERAIGQWLPIGGIVNVPEGTEIPLNSDELHSDELHSIELLGARPAGSNEPTVAGVEGSRRMMDLVTQATPRDLCVALISGGGSALMPLPIDGITLDDKLAVTRFLSGAGANITELNTVRKHLSLVKGGGLLAACRAGHLITLVLSDVLGDPLDLIASGPTVPDESSADDALQILHRFDPEKELPAAVYRSLESKRGRKPTRDPSKNTPVPFLIGNNAVAVDEAGIRAESLGYNHVMQSAKSCEGQAEDVGRHLAKLTLGMLSADPSMHRLDCLITGGEPVVKLAATDLRGRGGRNQQLVLAAYRYLRDQQLSQDEWDRLCILSGGTDGEDGPTDAAGAFINADVHRRIREIGGDVDSALERNDAYTFFAACGGLLMTGATGTNVCDLRVALVSR